MKSEFHAYVDNTLLRMFVLDESSDVVVEDIIDADLPRLEAADQALGSFGFRRTGDWTPLLRYWLTSAEKV